MVISSFTSPTCASNPQDASDNGGFLSGENVGISYAPATYRELATWCLTGMSGWWCLNAIVAELPHFVAVLPEGAILGNLIAVCTQLGNVAPMTYKSFYRQTNGRLTHVIGAFQLLAAATLVTCAQCWDTQVGGRSMVLLLCTALAGCVGCMSNVTYWAVAASRPASCTKAMSVGMTIGGMLTIGLSSLQIAGREVNDLRFSPKMYFYIAAAVQAVQGLAFLVQVLKMRQHQSDSRRPSQSPSLASFLSADAANRTGTFQSSILPPEIGREPETKARLPAVAKALLLGVFFLYATTYTMPSLLPFIATAYPTATEQQQLLLLMLVLQNAGDVVGRVSTSCSHGNVCVTVVSGLVLAAAFVAAVIFAVDRSLTANVWNYDAALWALPGLCGAYFFARGLLVTTLYLHARTLGDIGFATKLSLHMGLWGQMGALLATAFSFVMICGVHVMD